MTAKDLQEQLDRVRADLEAARRGVSLWGQALGNKLDKLGDQLASIQGQVATLNKQIGKLTGHQPDKSGPPASKHRGNRAANTLAKTDPIEDKTAEFKRPE